MKTIGELGLHHEISVHGGQSLFQHAEYYFTQSFIEESTITDRTIKARI